MMPDSADLTGEGTRMRSGSVWPRGGAAERSMLPPAPGAGVGDSHPPLRDCQSGRVICGRGYSGSGSVVLTCEVHGVDRGGGLGATAALAVGVTGIVQSSARTRTARRRIGLLGRGTHYRGLENRT